MLVLTGQNIKDFEKLEIDCHRVAYHNRASTGLKWTKRLPSAAFAADFSIASAMITIQPSKTIDCVQ